MKKVLVILLTVSSLFNFAYAAKYSIEAFFNHSESYNYTDPYRNITRKGQNLERVILDAIYSAESTIYIAVQELRLPLVAKALVKRHREGLDIRLILENSYNNTILTGGGEPLPGGGNIDSAYEASKRSELKALIDVNGDKKFSKKELLSRDAIYMIKNAKIPLKDDTHTRSPSLGSALMHHKFIVVDKKMVIASTANFTLSGVHGDILNPKSRGNANSLLRIYSPQLANHFTKEFMTMWGTKRMRGLFGASKNAQSLKETSIAKSKVMVQFSPTSKRLGWKKSVNGTISKELLRAKKDIKMALFVFSEQKIVDTLSAVRSRKSKLNMDILIERKFANREYSELLDMWGLEKRNPDCSIELKNKPWKTPLKTAGVPSLSSGDLLHHKFAVIDNQTVVVGSQNWSNAANTRNDENLLVIKDKYIASLYVEEFNRLNKFSNLGPSRRLLDQIDRLNERCSRSF